MPSKTASSKPKAKPPPAWGKSEAKKTLLNDILKGIVKRGDPPAEVWASREIFKQYDISRFGPNFRRLVDWVDNARSRATADAAAVANDRDLHPASEISSRGYPRWNGSVAERLLKEDIDNDKLADMKPAELRESREEYLAFPLDVFRKHKEQYLREAIEGEWWKEHWRQQKLKKYGFL
jgi:hypothetical protein